MTVLIKRHDIIYHLDGKQLDTPLKLTITTFRVKDGLLWVEKHSIIEIDDEVKYFYFYNYHICNPYILFSSLFNMYTCNNFI